jgi:monoamine oxidase
VAESVGERASRTRSSVVVVGGGIAGLYCAWELGRHGDFAVTLLDTRHEFGGRIESGRLDGFVAEYGPMRFEPGIQKRFVGLCKAVDLLDELEPFPEMTPETVEWPKYKLDPDEEGLSTLALLKRGVLGMFEEARTAAGAKDPDAWLRGLDESDFEALRRTATLNGIELYRRGLWNTLSEVLSHQAVMKIRDTGTFYHLIPDNPNAVEWGIFWLRLFKPEGRNLMAVRKKSGGVGEIVNRLVRMIETTCSGHVSLQRSQEVISIGHGRDPMAVGLEVRDKPSGRVYRLEADHIILALPQSPLLKLAENFPDQVRADLGSVVGVPLLKAFLVTTRPWWPPDQRERPQRGAGAIPTRELHYDRDESGKGIVMLYTDHPATEFWKYFIEDPAHHDQAEVYPRADGSENLALKNALVRYLISQGQRETAARQLVESAAPEEGISRRLVEARRESLNPLAESLARGLVRVFEERPKLVEVNPELRRVRDDMQEMTAVYDSITAYAIRDWSRDPFGAAAHAWRPRAKSWEVRDNLKAFGLIGRETVKNLHICGEAYSDYQGYIEGSLRSAIDALATLGVTSTLLEDDSC